MTLSRSAFLRLLSAGLGSAALSGCLSGANTGQGSGNSGGLGPSGGSGSGGDLRLAFWHTRRGDHEKSLQRLCEEYGRQNPGVRVEPLYQGNYDRLNQKIRASMQAKDLPALSVGYESQVVEYAGADVLVPLDPLVEDSQIGLKQEDLSDIPPLYLESNRYRQFENKLLSFPFTKSTLLLFFNKSLMQQSGFEKAPETWDEFERQAAAITAKTGKPAFVFDSDPSTLDGMIYSFGGDLLTTGGQTRFHERPTQDVLSLLQRMARAKTLVWATGDDAANLFLAGGCAFSTGTSSGLALAESQIGTEFDWDVAIIPHAPRVAPVTVMYGPNVCIFRSTPAQERAAWEFVKYFVSPEVTARWARETGYLPVRKSAVELPEMKQFYQDNPRSWHAYEAAHFAKGEPNVLGWQEVRDLLQAASNSVITSGADPKTAAVTLKQKADKVLAQSR